MADISDLLKQLKEGASKAAEAAKQALDAGVEKARDLAAEALSDEKHFPSQPTLRNYITDSKDKPEITKKYFRLYDLPPNGNLSRGEYQTSIGVDAATDITANSLKIAKIVKDLCSPDSKVDLKEVKDTASESGKDTLSFILKSALPLVWRDGNEVSLTKVGDLQTKYGKYYDAVKAGKSDEELRPQYEELKSSAISVMQDITRKEGKGASLSTPQNTLTADNISTAVNNLGGKVTSADSMPAHLAGQPTNQSKVVSV